MAWLVPFSAAVKFQFLPNPVDVGIIGTGAAIGALLEGALSWLLYPSEAVQKTAEGAFLGGAAGLLLLTLGLSGIQF